ncbi:MAG TPA: hypothetical protein VK167_06905 [Flavipsychrobacter sp.]|nr:hypothetical protein [Flavipsychrobacter sp.]
MRTTEFIRKNPVFVIVALCLLSRLPQLISPELYCDGDECVMGLMAEKMYEGKELPLFFWGQHYGFSLFECVSILPFYLLFGYTTIAVKLGILSVWTVGTTLLFKVVYKLLNEKLYPSMLMITGFILFPAWMLQSMKAWGGPVTSYMLSNLILYLLICKSYYQRWWFHLLIGILIALVYESQRLWLVGVLPVWIYMLYDKKKLIWSAPTLALAACICVLLWYYKQHIPETHVMPISIPETIRMTLFRFERFPMYLYGSLHDNYFFATCQNPNFFNAIAAIAGCALFFAVLIYGILHCASADKLKTMLTATIVFAPLVVVYSIFTEGPEGRYLLPVSGYVLISLAVIVSKLRFKKNYLTGIYLFFLIEGISTVCFYSFSDISASRRKSVKDMVSYLNKKQIHYVYSEDCMLPYELMFYSGNTIFARMPYQPARYQPASDSVDNALKCNESYAVVNYKNGSEGMWNSMIGFEDFYIVENMPKEIVVKAFDVKSYSGNSDVVISR